MIHFATRAITKLLAYLHLERFALAVKHLGLVMAIQVRSKTNFVSQNEFLFRLNFRQRLLRYCRRQMDSEGNRISFDVQAHG